MMTDEQQNADVSADAQPDDLSAEHLRKIENQPVNTYQLLGRDYFYGSYDFALKKQLPDDIEVARYQPMISTLQNQLLDDQQLDLTCRQQLFSLFEYDRLHQQTDIERVDPDTPTIRSLRKVSRTLLLDSQHQFDINPHIWSATSSIIRMTGSHPMFVIPDQIYQVSYDWLEAQTRVMLMLHHPKGDVIFGCSLTACTDISYGTDAFSWFDDDNQILFNNHPEIISNDELAARLRHSLGEEIRTSESAHNFKQSRQLARQPFETLPDARRAVSQRQQNQYFWSQLQAPSSSIGMQAVISQLSIPAEMIEIDDHQQDELAGLLNQLLDLSVLHFKWGRTAHDWHVMTGLEILEWAHLKKVKKRRQMKHHRQSAKLDPDDVLKSGDFDLPTDSPLLIDEAQGGSQRSPFLRLNFVDGDLQFTPQWLTACLDKPLILVPETVVMTGNDIYGFCLFGLTDKRQRFASKVQCQFHLHRTKSDQLTFRVNDLTGSRSEVSDFVSVSSSDEMPEEFVNRAVDYHRTKSRSRKPSYKNQQQQMVDYMEHMADLISRKFDGSMPTFKLHTKKSVEEQAAETYRSITERDFWK